MKIFQLMLFWIPWITFYMSQSLSSQKCDQSLPQEPASTFQQGQLLMLSNAGRPANPGSSGGQGFKRKCLHNTKYNKIFDLNKELAWLKIRNHASELGLLWILSYWFGVFFKMERIVSGKSTSKRKEQFCPWNAFCILYIKNLVK